jgi:predicted membrane protein
MFNLDFLFNTVGMIGAILILIAFFLIQTDKIKSDDLSFPVLNSLGALFLLVSLLRFWNLASVFIEVCWIAIGVYGIIKNVKKRKGT